jgi:hypothetical protein
VLTLIVAYPKLIEILLKGDTPIYLRKYHTPLIFDKIRNVYKKSLKSRTETKDAIKIPAHQHEFF